jgi:hypothetical protein
MSELFSVAFLVFALAIAALTFVVRKVVEFSTTTRGQNRIWRDLILPVLPILIGTLLAMPSAFAPFAAPFSGMLGRMLVGAVAGLLSGFVFRWAKAFLKRKREGTEP